MRPDTVKALRMWRNSKALALNVEAFKSIIDDIKNATADELWAQTEKKGEKKPADPLLMSVKKALSKYKTPLATKAQELTAYLLPDRTAAAPKSMPSALKVLRSYLTEEQILAGAEALMARVRAEVGTDVPL